MFPRKIVPVALAWWLSFGGGLGQEASPQLRLPAFPMPEPSRLELFPQQVKIAPLVSTNQRMADAIARTLKECGQLRQYRVDIAYADGLADLSGLVADMPQRDEVLRIVQAVPGVQQVRDRMVVLSGHLLPVQASLPAPGPVVVQGPQPEVGPSPAKVETPDGKLQEPMSILPPMGPGGAQALPNPAYQPPPMPPYAWPTYAPYNNYSRVAYPTLYPYEAWPFIGPMYPFPKVPPGWRAVTLRWQDGHWWYGKGATGHDWWRIRYW